MATKQEPIQSFVFMKTITTGRYWKEYGHPKIVELNFTAVDRRDLERGEAKKIPAALKLNIVFNPDHPISQSASNVHDLTDDFVQNAVSFDESVGSIVAFLQVLPKPVCLIAYNGVALDFKHLKRECVDAGVNLPEDLLYADCKWIFYYYLCEVTEEMNSDEEMDKKKNQIGLSSLFEKLFGEPAVQPRTAEQHVLMMLDCVLLKKEAFLMLANEKCELFSGVLPVGEKKEKNVKVKSEV